MIELSCIKPSFCVVVCIISYENAVELNRVYLSKKYYTPLYGFGIEEDIKASNRMCAKKYFEECHSNLSKDCI